MIFREALAWRSSVLAVGAKSPDGFFALIV
jgi:hypothetical protein